MSLQSTSLLVLRKVFSSLRRCEFKDNHGEWINSVQPDIGSDTAGRIKDALEASSDLVSLIHKIREQSRLAMNELLKVVTLPSLSRTRHTGFYWSQGHARMLYCEYN